MMDVNKAGARPARRWAWLRLPFSQDAAQWNRRLAVWDDRLLRALTPPRLRVMHPAWRYGLTVVIIGLTAVLRRSLTPWMGTTVPYNINFPTLIITTMLLGSGPGLLIVLLGTAVVEAVVLDTRVASLHGETLVRIGTSMVIGLLVCGIIHAIRATQLKATRSERRYRSLVELSPDAIIIHQDGHFVYANPAALQLFGAASEEWLLGRPVLELIHPDDRELVGARMHAAVGGTQAQLRVVRVVRPDGEVRYVESAGAQMDFGGRPAVQVVIRDITERKRTELVLQTTLRRLHALVSSMPNGVLLVGEAHVELANQAFCDCFHLPESPEDLVGLAPGDMVAKIKPAYLHPDAEAARISEIVTRCQPVLGEEVAMQDGRFFVREFIPIFENGELNFRLWYHVDITARKRAEAELQELSQRLTYHVDHSPLAVIEWGPDMRLSRWSGAAERVFGWKAGEVLGKRMEDFRWIYAEDVAQVEEVSTELRTGANPRRFSANRNYRKDGSVADCEWYNSSLVDASGKLRSILSLVLDVTERNQAEARLKESLQTKDVLLKEVHHRVKNNLQVISSLVSLHGAALDNPGLRAAFDGVRDQVRAMALVHEKLYRSGDLAHVPFEEYARHLLDYLWRGHGAAAAHVALSLDLAPVALSVELAVPCGLILNELAVNALKHAFRECRQGEVTVSLRETPERQVCLSVRDNGVGLPSGLDWRQAQSLGLRLVQMLATQVNGTVSAHSDASGTAFELVFER